MGSAELVQLHRVLGAHAPALAVRHALERLRIVARDRYLLDQLPTQVVEVGDGHAVRYLGNYEDYLRAKAEAEAAREAKARTASRR